MPHPTYTTANIQMLAEHYFDSHETIEAVEVFADFDAALAWLKDQASDLHALLLLWMTGEHEAELATRFRLRARTLSRLLDATFDIMARYLNQEYPIILPWLPSFQDLRTPEDYTVYLVNLSVIGDIVPSI